jgi:hypothetical protein
VPGGAGLRPSGCGSDSGAAHVQSSPHSANKTHRKALMLFGQSLAYLWQMWHTIGDMVALEVNQKVTKRDVVFWNKTSSAVATLALHLVTYPYMLIASFFVNTA